MVYPAIPSGPITLIDVANEADLFIAEAYFYDKAFYDNAFYDKAFYDKAI